MHTGILGVTQMASQPLILLKSRCYPTLFGVSLFKSLYGGFSHHWLNKPQVMALDLSSQAATCVYTTYTTYTTVRSKKLL